MRRRGQYADSSVNSYVSAQMQQMSAQRMQRKSGMNHFVGQSDALPTDEENSYLSSKAEGQWQWDRDGPKASNSLFNEGQGGDASRSFYQGQRLDPEKEGNNDLRVQTHGQEMDIGYVDNILQTFEGLEHKFHDNIMKLTEEQRDAEDTENARHREKISEINTQYQEKLTALRVRHASRRDEILCSDSQARQRQYHRHQAGMGYYQKNAGSSDPHGYSGAAAETATAAAREAHESYAAGQFDSYREQAQAQYLEDAKNNRFKSRSPYPGGRVYHTGARYY